MKVTILDTRTKKKTAIDLPYNATWWYEGNGSCDCNRAIFSKVDLTYQNKNQRLECLGCHRFLITAIESNEYSLIELNEDYPYSLLKKHGIIKNT